MSLREFTPHPTLAPYVDRFWAREQPPGSGVVPAYILPGGCIDLIFDVTSGWTPMVVGAMTRSSQFVPTAGTPMVGVRFRPGGALPFLGVPAQRPSISSSVAVPGWRELPSRPDTSIRRTCTATSRS